MEWKQCLPCRWQGFTWHRPEPPEPFGQQDGEGDRSLERGLNKLSRTFTTQMEALKRYRSKGANQRIVVERVNVSEGGQAIVGNVDRGEVK